MTGPFFTLDEANALLPWLEDKLAGMIPDRDRLAAEQERLLELLRRRRSNGHSSSEEEILECKGKVDRLTQGLQEDLKPLAQFAPPVYDCRDFRHPVNSLDSALNPWSQDKF